MGTPLLLKWGQAFFLALHLYHSLSSEEWERRIEATLAYFEGKSSAKDFLAGFPGALVADVLAASASMVPGRRAALEALRLSPPG